MSCDCLSYIYNITDRVLSYANRRDAYVRRDWIDKTPLIRDRFADQRLLSEAHSLPNRYLQRDRGQNIGCNYKNT